MRLTILCDNTAAPSLDILGEHGFAVLIEKNRNVFLFDTGQGLSILPNAQSLGKDLTRVSRIFLSHGHYDHTGGLTKVLEITGPRAVHAHPDIFIERIARMNKAGKQVQKQVGMREKQKELEACGARFVFNTSFTEVAQGLYLTGEIPRTTFFEKADKRLAFKPKKRLVQDTVRDDQSLVLQTPRGLVVIAGCAHAGIINTLQHVRKKLPGRKIYMLLGGTHLGYLSAGPVAHSIEHLKGFNIRRIGVSHCTGPVPAMKLMQAFGSRFFCAHAGAVIDV